MNRIVSPSWCDKNQSPTIEKEKANIRGIISLDRSCRYKNISSRIKIAKATKPDLETNP